LRELGEEFEPEQLIDLFAHLILKGKEDANGASAFLFKSMNLSV
jgi:hypothetical protein